MTDLIPEESPTDLDWHYMVREHIGEKLYIFFLVVRPLNPAQVYHVVQDVMNRRGYSSFDCDPVFGRFDAVVKVWLNPNDADSVQHEMNQALRSSSEFCGIQGMSAKIFHKQYWKGTHAVPSQRTIRRLEEAAIIKLQDEGRSELREDLWQQDIGVRLRTPHNGTIRFFIGITNDRTADTTCGEQTERLLRSVAEKVDSSPAFVDLSIYVGTSALYSSVLELETTDYFAIADLLLWLGVEAPHVHSETLLVGLPERLCGDGRIGKASFKWLDKQSLFVKNIVPEIYSVEHEFDAERVRQLVRVFVDEVELAIQGCELSPGRLFLHDYALAFLGDDEHGRASALFDYCAPFEKYLRSNVNEFAGRKLGDRVTEFFRKFRKADGMQPTLGDLFQMYEWIIRTTSDTEHEDLCGGWQDFVELRNIAVHAAEQDWKMALLTAAKAMRRVDAFVEMIEAVTQRRITSKFHRTDY